MIFSHGLFGRASSAGIDEREKMTVSPAKIAAWMLEEVEQTGVLYQVEVVEYLRAKYGGECECTYINSNGNLAIAKPILAAFNRLTANNVVWVRAPHYWRKRQASDGPSRQR